MTVTDQQIRAITFLATAARPSGARRWNEAGIIAAVEKVRSRSLPEVVIAVIRAAADGNADTPGVIPTAGPHWRNWDDDGEQQVIERYDPATVCGICGKPDWRCRQVPIRDHEFVSAHEVARQRVAAKDRTPAATNPSPTA